MRNVLRQVCGGKEGYQDGQQVVVWQPPRYSQIRDQAPPLRLSQEAAQRCKEEARKSWRLPSLWKRVSQITAARMHGLHDRRILFKGVPKGPLVSPQARMRLSRSDETRPPGGLCHDKNLASLLQHGLISSFILSLSFAAPCHPPDAMTG